MIRLSLGACALGLTAFTLPLFAQGSTPLAEGALAPEFALAAADQAGVRDAPVHLRDFRGQTVVLAFFYKARTKG
jgi:hypothetical protein